tara:strand:+ start:3344 stop:3625 length:282 start_codon:yes stop_codon:yes gene_type:complete
MNNNLQKNKTEEITLDEFRDNFQRVVSQCERGQSYRIVSDFGLLELKWVDEKTSGYVRPLHKPTWPPADTYAGNYDKKEYRDFERRLNGPCDI